MSSPSKTLRRFKMVLFMAALSLLFVGAVSAVHLSTRTIVQRNEALFLQKSVLYTAGRTPPTSPKELNALFRRVVREHKIGGKIAYYTVTKGSERVFVLIQSGSGLWGEIRAHVGFKQDLKTLAGLNFLVQSETPGLGARIAESWFREQFRGKRGPLSLVPEGTKNEGVNQFDAITGATVTSKAVRTIVNTATARIAKTVGSPRGAKGVAQ